MPPASEASREPRTSGPLTPSGKLESTPLSPERTRAGVCFLPCVPRGHRDCAKGRPSQELPLPLHPPGTRKDLSLPKNHQVTGKDKQPLTSEKSLN